MRPLLDGVKPGEIHISKESQSLSLMVKDSKLSLVDRLESFEDIINIEVGDTGLRRARALERSLNLKQLFFKYEGDNPTGTQKDRIAFAQVYDALRHGYEDICLATCGNYGVAVSLAANLAGMKCHVFIPESYHTDRIAEMESLGSIVYRFSGSYEDLVFKSRKDAEEYDWYDANPGGKNASLQINAYAQIAYEIYDDLRDAPKMIAVPISNGTLIAGVYRGFVSLFQRGKTSRIPKLIAASAANKNPIIYSFLQGYDQCVDLDPDSLKETKVNEPLINWHSFDGEEALYGLRQSEGYGFNISDRKLLEMNRYLLKSEGLKILPASTAGLVALIELHKKTPLEADRYVALITAKE
jgi:threonine synthase